MKIEIFVVNLHLPRRILLEKEDTRLSPYRYPRQSCKIRMWAVINLKRLEKWNNSPFLQCFWTIHFDLETVVEEIFIGTKCTPGPEIEITLLRTTSYLQHFKKIWSFGSLTAFTKSFIFFDTGIFRVCWKYFPKKIAHKKIITFLSDRPVKLKLELLSEKKCEICSKSYIYHGNITVKPRLHSFIYY